MAGGEVYTKVLEWIAEDPSPLRVGLAVDHYNWDAGEGFMVRVAEGHDLDTCVAFDMLRRAAPIEFFELRSRAEVPAEAGPVAPIFDALEAGWRSGRHRTQRFGSGEIEHLARRDQRTYRRAGEAIRFAVDRPDGHYSILREIALQPGLPDLGEDDLEAGDRERFWAAMGGLGVL